MKSFYSNLQKCFMLRSFCMIAIGFMLRGFCMIAIGFMSRGLMETLKKCFDFTLNQQIIGKSIHFLNCSESFLQSEWRHISNNENVQQSYANPTSFVRVLWETVFSEQVRTWLDILPSDRTNLVNTDKILLSADARYVLLHAFDGRASVALEGVSSGFYFSVTASVCRDPQVSDRASCLQNV